MTNTTRRWQPRGACRFEDPDLFFPVGTTGPALAQTEDAKRVCRRCPVILQCQQWALENHVEEGVWGGLDERQRRSLLRHRARGTTAVAPRVPLPSFDTCRDAYNFMAFDVEGHIVWTGPIQVRIGEERRSRNQIAWEAIHGTPPVGRVQPDCDRDSCVQHLTDQATRNARSRDSAVDLPLAV
ncbi:hypothetical protein STAN_1833 [Streptomyces sp. CBMAI 2042]|nr:hypothetical protein STAN_1833 [Streptomyces sp. CBMAI 2042]